MTEECITPLRRRMIEDMSVRHFAAAESDPPSKWWTPLISSYWSWKGV
jgi:hypothetical protein